MFYAKYYHYIPTTMKLSFQLQNKQNKEKLILHFCVDNQWHFTLGKRGQGQRGKNKNAIFNSIHRVKLTK